jgi:KDO2-lipid IV(A) lauroyltransferase
LLSKKGGGSDMLQYMERRGNLGLLADQDAGEKGLFVPFFGKPASTFKSVALLALQYRAIVMVGYARRLPDDFLNRRWVRYELGCEDIIDAAEFDGPDAVRELTERYTAALERVVRLSPEQYFWVHRRWKSEPRQRKSARKQAA